MACLSSAPVDMMVLRPWCQLKYLPPRLVFWVVQPWPGKSSALKSLLKMATSPDGWAFWKVAEMVWSTPTRWKV